MICDVCGVSSEQKKIKYNTKARMHLCRKHSNQYARFGKCLDTNRQTRKDPNQYRIFDNYIEVDCYDNCGNVIATFTADVEDLHYVIAHKWRVTPKRNKLYVVTGNNRNYPVTYFHRMILNYTGDMEVDHIDGNALNNKKDNLRLVSRQEQVQNNKPKINNNYGIRGISKDNRNNKYVIEFIINKHRLYLKPFKDFNEAVYARYLLEKELKPNRYTENDNYIFQFINQLSKANKTKIEKYIDEKVRCFNQECGS